MNRNLADLKPSASIAMMDRARTMKAQGIHVISLAGGEPDFDTPLPVTEAGIRAIRDGKTHYTMGRGIVPLRERIAKKLLKENRINCTAENVLVTPGGKYAIHLALFTFLNPGDEVMILDPSWVSYGPLVTMTGAVPVKVPLSFTNQYAISKDLLDAYATGKTKILIVNTPNNPTGRVLTEREAAEIRSFLICHPEILVISDEVYEKIIFDGRKHISLASYPDVSDRVITVNSFSKSAAMTGWRVGYAAGKKELIDAMYLCYQHTQTCISEFSQIAAITALDCISEMEAMRQSYAKRRDLLIGGLQSVPAASCLKPEGAFYAWCRFEIDGLDSDGIAAFLLNEAQVVTVSGAAYGFGSEKCVRMCFASSEEDLSEALERIKKAL